MVGIQIQTSDDFFMSRVELWVNAALFTVDGRWLVG